MLSVSKISTIVLAIPLCLLVACGDDDDDGPDTTPDAAQGGPDAPTADTPDAAAASADATDVDASAVTACTQPALAPTDDQSAAGVPDYMISEVSIDGNFVELYNNTDAPIDLSVRAEIWCSRPSYPAVSSAAVTVPARGYATVPFPTSAQTNSDGELVLYANAQYANTSSVLDYLCWGTTPPDATRKATAEAAGKWAAACVGNIPGGGSIQRTAGTAGDQASDYQILATPTPENCTTQP